MLCCWAQYLTFYHNLQCRAFLVDRLSTHTASHPRPESSIQFSFCDNLYAIPQERPWPSGQPRTWPLIFTWSQVSRMNTYSLPSICFSLASCLSTFPHCHQLSLVLQGSFCLELLCSVLIGIDRRQWCDVGTWNNRWLMAWNLTAWLHSFRNPIKAPRLCFIYKRLCYLLYHEVLIV